jgi:hypothetical protein
MEQAESTKTACSQRARGARGQATDRPQPKSPATLLLLCCDSAELGRRAFILSVRLPGARILRARCLEEADKIFGRSCADVVIECGAISRATLNQFATATVTWPLAAAWQRKAASTAAALERIVYASTRVTRNADQARAQ